jgi:hypothetical protein
MPADTVRRMNARGRVLTAAATAALLSTMLSACSHTASGSGSLGQANSTGDAGIGSPAPAPSPGGTQGQHGGGTGGGGNGGTGSPSASASSSQPNTGGTNVFTFAASNYAVAGTGSCSWILDGANRIQLWVGFTITHSGLLTAPVPWSVGDDKDSYSETGTTTAFPATVTAKLGGDTSLFSASKWPGTTVTVTMTLMPQGGDGSSSDNKASVRVTVPDSAPGVDLLEPLTCS